MMSMEKQFFKTKICGTKLHPLATTGALQVHLVDLYFRVGNYDPPFIKEGNYIHTYIHT